MTTLGKYEVQEKLGEGTFAEVFKAVNPNLGSPVALKVLRGGSFYDYERNVRCAYRNFSVPCKPYNNTGFRKCILSEVWNDQNYISDLRLMVRM
jgi:serine/threonine protein kinase